MGNKDVRTTKQFAALIQEVKKDKTSAYDTSATVVRMDGGTAWVHIPGGVDETPVQATIAASAGDSVRVRVSGGRAWITGNATSPPTDDTTAVTAIETATVAAGTAETALQKVEELSVLKLSVGVAEITYAQITELNAVKENVNTLTAENATINQKLVAAAADIEDLSTSKLSVDDAEATYASIKSLKAAQADIESLSTSKLSVDDAKITYADIDFENVIHLEAAQAVIQKLFVTGGLMTEDVTAVTGEFTKYLTGVNISGDLITAGTISTERLIIRSADTDEGILFALNDAGEIDQSTLTAEELKRLTLDGKLITAETITADKIAVTDLSAFGATIGAFDISYTTDADGTANGSIKAGKTGLYDSAAGIYLGTDGIAAGDGTLYGWTQESPFRVNADGTFWVGNSGGHISVTPPDGEEEAKFEIATKSLTIGSAEIGEVLSEAIKDTQTQYGVSTSPEEEPTEWSTDAPGWAAGSYIWQRPLNSYMDGHTSAGGAVCVTGNSGEDAVTLYIESSRGMVFKNDSINTVLSVVIYCGALRITDMDTLKTAVGDDASLAWSFQRMSDDTIYAIDSSDVRIGGDGFTFTISPDDVDAKATFFCELNI